MRSMTGFGRYLVENDLLTQQWEIKSVNSRHLDIKWRLPLIVRNLEPKLEKIVRQHANRGRIDISLNLQFSENASPLTKFNIEQAKSMLDMLEELAKLKGHNYTPDYNALLNIPHLWNELDSTIDEQFIPDLIEGITLTLNDWNESRIAEGNALAKDLLIRIQQMEEWANFFIENAPIIKIEREKLMKERIIESLNKNDQELLESRFIQEIAILADKLDVSEELVRLTTHLNRLKNLLETNDDAGRKLDFTLQECFREINTFGNKIPDVKLSHIVVDFKNELEKCREQVQNLE